MVIRDHAVGESSVSFDTPKPEDINILVTSQSRKKRNIQVRNIVDPWLNNEFLDVHLSKPHIFHPNLATQFRN